MYTIVYTQKVAHTGQILTSGFINDAYNSDTPTPFHMQGLNVLEKSLQSQKMKTKPDLQIPGTSVFSRDLILKEKIGGIACFGGGI